MTAEIPADVLDRCKATAEEPSAQAVIDILHEAGWPELVAERDRLLAENDIARQSPAVAKAMARFNDAMDSQHRSLIAELEADRNRLRAGNFRLAADQCHDGYGDEWGNHQCRKIDAAQALITELVAGLSEALEHVCDDGTPEYAEERALRARLGVLIAKARWPGGEKAEGK